MDELRLCTSIGHLDCICTGGDGWFALGLSLAGWTLDHGRVQRFWWQVSALGLPMP